MMEEVILHRRIILHGRGYSLRKKSFFTEELTLPI